jgi:hypothetical protein
MATNQYTPEQVTKLGEDIYFSKLQSKLEPKENGKYIVLDVESEKYFVNEDLMVAINEAQAKFPESLFYIASIGSITRPMMNNFSYAWQL